MQIDVKKCERLRKRTRLSFEQVAREITALGEPVTTRTVVAWFKDGRVPSGKYIPELAAVLGVVERALFLPRAPALRRNGRRARK